MSNQLAFFKEVQEKQESGFGPSLYRIIGKMVFAMGYKVYGQKGAGLTNDQTFFPFADKEGEESAQAAAIAFNKENGSDPSKAPQVIYNFIVYKDDLLAGATGWNVDQHFSRDKWREKTGEEKINGEDVEYDDRIVFKSVLPFVEGGKLTIGEPFWGSLKNENSPYHVRRENKTERWTNKDGEEVVSYKTFKVLDAVFANQAVAQAAADSTPARGAEQVDDESFPGKFDSATKWTPGDWASKGKTTIMTLLGNGMSMEAVAGALDAPLEAVQLAVAQVEAK